MFVTGDFNLHHLLWSSDPTVSPTPMGEELVEWMTRNHYTLLNQPGEMTFKRGLDDSAVLDLSWATWNLLHQVSDWTVHSSMDFASDHYPISWRFTPQMGTVDDPDPLLRFKFTEEVYPNWIETFTKLTRPLPPTPDEPSLEQWMEVTDHLHGSMLQASITHVGKQKLHPHPSPWFISEVRDTLRVYRNAKATFKSGKLRGAPNLLLLFAAL